MRSSSTSSSSRSTVPSSRSEEEEEEEAVRAPSTVYSASTSAVQCVVLLYSILLVVPLHRSVHEYSSGRWYYCMYSTRGGGVRMYCTHDHYYS